MAVTTYTLPPTLRKIIKHSCPEQVTINAAGSMNLGSYSVQLPTKGARPERGVDHVLTGDDAAHLLDTATISYDSDSYTLCLADKAGTALVSTTEGSCGSEYHTLPADGQAIDLTRGRAESLSVLKNYVASPTAKERTCLDRVLLKEDYLMATNKYRALRIPLGSVGISPDGLKTLTQEATVLLTAKFNARNHSLSFTDATMQVSAGTAASPVVYTASYIDENVQAPNLPAIFNRDWKPVSTLDVSALKDALSDLEPTAKELKKNRELGLHINWENGALGSFHHSAAAPEPLGITLPTTLPSKAPELGREVTFNSVYLTSVLTDAVNVALAAREQSIHVDNTGTSGSGPHRFWVGSKKSPIFDALLMPIRK